MTVTANPMITLAWDALKSPEMQKALGQLGQFSQGKATVLGSTVAESTLRAGQQFEQAQAKQRAAHEARKAPKVAPAPGLVPDSKRKPKPI